MASLRKRNGFYSIVFITYVNGKRITKIFALGTKRKQIADQKRNHYEKLYESGELNPFEPGWNLKDFEQRQMDTESIEKRETEKALTTEGNYEGGCRGAECT